MTEMMFKKGLLPLDSVKHARFKFAAEYGITLETPVYPIDKTGGITNYGMGGNGPDATLTVNGGQPVGDCGVCAVPFHANMITAMMAGLDLSQWTMTSDQVVNLYFEYTGGQDTGVDLGDWLLWLFDKGLILGFVKLDVNDLDAALQTFDVVVVGVNLNPQADQQVANGQMWDISAGDEPDPMMGHAILYMKAQSSTGPYGWCTWGQEQDSTFAWKQTCPQQAFGVVTNPDKFGAAYSQLVADLHALNGTVSPITPPVAPAQVITSPKPITGVAPITGFHDFIAELDRLRNWANDRKLFHEMLASSVEQEAINLLTNELGNIIKRVVL